MESSLDNFIQQYGEEVTDKELNMVSKQREHEIKESVNKYAYDIYDEPIPGQDVGNKISSTINSINESTALSSLIMQSAMIKAKNSNDETVKEVKREMSKAEKEAAKKQFVDAMLYQQGELYFQQHHYIMDGKTKRSIRKRIERDYDKGKFQNKNYFKEPQGRKIVRKPKVQKTEDSLPVNVNSFIKM